MNAVHITETETGCHNDHTIFGPINQSQTLIPTCVRGASFIKRQVTNSAATLQLNINTCFLMDSGVQNSLGKCLHSSHEIWHLRPFTARGHVEHNARDRSH